MKQWQINLSKHLSNNIKTHVAFTSQKLSIQCNVKDKNKIENKHDVIHFGKCPGQHCTDNYLGESARRITEQITDHSRTGQKSHLFRHAVVNKHRNASYDDSKIIESGFRNKTFKRKVDEALLIKEL